jgi:hypothetical protein
MQLDVVPSECKMALKRRFRDEDSTGTDFRLNSDTHICEDDISPHSDDIKQDYTMDVGCRHWTDTIGCKTSAYVILHLRNVLLLSVAVQMGDDQRGRLEEYSSALEPFFTAFWGNTMKLGRCFHMLRLLHFSNNKNETDKTKVMTGCGRWEIFLLSLTMHLLNVTAQLNI